MEESSVDHINSVTIAQQMERKYLTTASGHERTQVILTTVPVYLPVEASRLKSLPEPNIG